MFMDFFGWKIELLKLNSWYIGLAKELNGLKVIWVRFDILNHSSQGLCHVNISFFKNYSLGIHIFIVARLGNSFDLALRNFLLKE